MNRLGAQPCMRCVRDSYPTSWPFGRAATGDPNSEVKTEIHSLRSGYRESKVIVTGWSNGSATETGAGYGIRIARGDRDRFFQRDWPSVTIRFEGGGEAEVRVSASFWAECIELRSARIGRWMIGRGLAPWPTGNPPKMRLEPMGERGFRLGRM